MMHRWSECPYVQPSVTETQAIPSHGTQHKFSGHVTEAGDSAAHELQLLSIRVDSIASTLTNQQASINALASRLDHVSASMSARLDSLFHAVAQLQLAHTTSLATHSQFGDWQRSPGYQQEVYSRPPPTPQHPRPAGPYQQEGRTTCVICGRASHPTDSCWVVRPELCKDPANLPGYYQQLPEHLRPIFSHYCHLRNILVPLPPRSH